LVPVHDVDRRVLALRHPWGWRGAGLLCVTGMLAGLMYAVAKWLAGRVRPVVRIEPYQFSPFPNGLAGLFNADNMSFPSGHATLAFATAATLAHLMPRYNWGFYLVAAIVGIERVLEQAHYLSDVIAAAAFRCARVPRVAGGAQSRRSAESPNHRSRNRTVQPRCNAMNPSMLAFVHTFWITAASLTLLAAALSIVPGWDARAARCRTSATRAPLLDLIVSAFTWLPWAVARRWRVGRGSSARFAGQCVALGMWVVGHELAYREAARGPRIVKFINRTVGRWRNHLALWVTLVALPGFLFIRFIQIACYWTLPLLLGLPEVQAVRMDQLQPPEVRGPRRARPHLVPVLRLDDGRVFAGRGDAAERRIVLVPDPVLRREEVRQLPHRFPRHRTRLGASRRDDARGRAGHGREVRRRASARGSGIPCG
jgi:hypothetical protein